MSGACVLLPAIVSFAQMGGMMGRCPMCGSGESLKVPADLPQPRTKWVEELQRVLAKERQSLDQYRQDSERFNTHMPYMMVVPQEKNHVEVITKLFSAYGLPADGIVAKTVRSKNLRDAYKRAVDLEKDLIERYEWLIQDQGMDDEDSRRILNELLLQSRLHLTMFQHAIRMGP